MSFAFFILEAIDNQVHFHRGLKKMRKSMAKSPSVAWYVLPTGGDYEVTL